MKKMPPPDQPPARTSPEERAYFQEVEAHFIRLRGRPLILSPRELERTASWHREGIPLQVVCRGIDRYFDKRFGTGSASRQRAVSLQYCEDFIREVLDETRRMAVGGGGAAVEGEGGGLVAGLDGLLTRLEQARATLSGDPSLSDLVLHLHRASSVIHGLLERARIVNPPDGPLSVRETESDLEKLDRVIIDELRRNAGPAALEDLRRACDAEMQEVAGKMDPALYQATLKRMVTRRLRDSRRIPELSFFAL
jgi:hypothetical protein